LSLCVSESTVITALLWAITQPVVVIPYRRFRTTYLSHLDSRPEKSARAYHLLRGGSVRSRKQSVCVKVGGVYAVNTVPQKAKETKCN